MRRKENSGSSGIGRSSSKIKDRYCCQAERKKTVARGWFAEQRKAIVDGLADSIKELKGANVDLTEEQIMSILLTNQYLDTLNNFADKEGIIRFPTSKPRWCRKHSLHKYYRLESKVNFYHFF